MAKKRKRKVSEHHVQPHKHRLTRLAKRMHENIYSSSTSPDYTWASSPDDQSVGRGIYGWGGGIGNWGTP